MTDPGISAAAAGADLDNCAREPIRIPGGIQPHGALMVLDPADLKVLQVSRNLAGLTGLPSLAGAGGRLGETATAAFGAELQRWAAGGESLFLRTLSVAGRSLQVSAHRTEQGLLVEFEPPPGSEDETLEAVYPSLRKFVDTVDQAGDIQSIAELAVRHLRALTGFNRVMLYSFDDRGDGTVLAEDNDGVLPSYLDLRFPASDIPAQARELYRLNRLRLIPDAVYTPVPIEPMVSPVDDRPLDLGLASLRSVSPIHLEYMRNMGTAASMSISILIDGALWGLISCHNQAPRIVNAQIRSACDFLGQIISLQIGARERSAESADRLALKQIEGELLAQMSATPSFANVIGEIGPRLCKLVNATGAVLITEEHYVAVGNTPSGVEVQELVRWLRRRNFGDVYATDSLAGVWSPGESFAEVGSGLLAISISQLHASYILWFREEVVRTVKWGGDPRKAPDVDRLYPRKSFEIWKQQVHLHSLRWKKVEIEAATDFRNAVINFVLRRAEERAELTTQLQRSNSELEAFSYSISHDLRAPFRHIAGYAQLLSDRESGLDEKSKHYLNSIVDATASAGRLVDDLLNFSQLGRTPVARVRVDMKKLVNEVLRSVEPELDGRTVRWDIGSLPPAWGDPALLRQVWSNLIDNALKYTRGREEAVISISGVGHGEYIAYVIGDNGVGFEMAYVGKLFGVFQRLHRAEEFPGTGIGLALSKRIIDRHGGTIAARGEVGKGAEFEFRLPASVKR